MRFLVVWQERRTGLFANQENSTCVGPVGTAVNSEGTSVGTVNRKA